MHKFEALIEKLQSHKEKMEQQIHDKKAEVAEREAELQEALREKGELSDIVSRQVTTFDSNSTTWCLSTLNNVYCDGVGNVRRRCSAPTSRPSANG
eukprot:SAG31_NODE_2836_length_5019_cov_2.059350_5_plen_96_part_00